MKRSAHRTRGRWNAAVLILVIGVAPLACATATRTGILSAIFDGVPRPGDKAEALPGGQKTLPRELSRQPTAVAGNPVAVRPIISAAPFEALKTWGAVLKALPTATDGGVDWVRAFQEALVTPRLLPEITEEIERPLTLDTVMGAVVSDPRDPALDLTVRITPAGLPPGTASLYEVTFPHSSHTAWLGCSSCHPGVLATRTGMLGILKGDSCGRCHGRVAFAPEVSCGRCHTKLAPPSAETLAAEVLRAGREPVASSPDVIARGQAVYRQMCAVCHGEAGDGTGPLAPEVDPKPRDFTAGKYKFRTTLPSSIPTDLDLLTTITRGVPGTSMPAFAAMPREDRWALTHYIKTFSDKFVKSKAEPIPMAAAPAVTAELLAMGLDLYKQAGCNTCHGDEGRGDGPSAPTLKDDAGDAIRPFNFVRGQPMKGGSGPDAVYRTVMTGLQGTPMPGFGDALTPEQGWALAAYVETFFNQDRQPFAVQGDIHFVRAGRAPGDRGPLDYPPVVFPHWFHRIRAKCASCHPRVFEMRAGANAVSMDAMRRGQFCGTCHNGTTAWEIGFTTCVRCHATPKPASLSTPMAASARAPHLGAR